jgi:hypothetical protein
MILLSAALLVLFDEKPAHFGIQGLKPSVHENDDPVSAPHQALLFLRGRL